MDNWLIEHFLPLCGLLLSLYAGWRIWDYSWREEKNLRKRMEEADDGIKHRSRAGLTKNTVGCCFPFLVVLVIGLICTAWLLWG